MDRPLHDHTGQQPPVAKNGRRQADAPDSFGRHLVVVRRQGGHDRLPVDGAMVRRQGHPPDRAEPRLVRWLLVRFQRPAWAAMVGVVAEAAVAAQAPLQRIRQRGYGVVRAWARTWGVDKGPTRNARGTPWPNTPDRRGWGPVEAPGRRRTEGPDPNRARLRHRGEVTILLRQQRRTAGPQATTLVVPNRPDVTARQVVDGSRRRCTVERRRNALQGATGVGQPQVTQEPPRVARAGALSVMADRGIVTFRAQASPEPGSGSLLTLQPHCPWQLAQGPLERAAAQRLRTALQEREAA